VEEGRIVHLPPTVARCSFGTRSEGALTDYRAGSVADGFQRWTKSNTCLVRSSLGTGRSCRSRSRATAPSHISFA
jgi:hypothetical protein